jgi:hypothetical protein
MKLSKDKMNRNLPKLILNYFKIDNPHGTTGLPDSTIFQNNQGNLVVNEFESLDANYDGEATCESVTKTFLHAYWKRVINAKLDECNLSID